MSKKKSTKFPKALLNQINEFSGGGFVLFNIGPNNGLEIHSTFDTPIFAAARQHYIEIWAKSMEAAGIEKAILSMTDRSHPDDPGYEED